MSIETADPNEPKWHVGFDGEITPGTWSLNQIAAMIARRTSASGALIMHPTHTHGEWLPPSQIPQLKTVQGRGPAIPSAPQPSFSAILQPMIKPAAFFAAFIIICSGVMITTQPTEATKQKEHDRVQLAKEMNADYVDAVVALNPNIIGGDYDETQIIFMVDQSWHVAAKQYRLQEAQRIASSAKTAASPDVIITFVDISNNEVGGSHSFGGVWVQD